VISSGQRTVLNVFDFSSKNSLFTKTIHPTAQLLSAAYHTKRREIVTSWTEEEIHIHSYRLGSSFGFKVTLRTRIVLRDKLVASLCLDEENDLIYGACELGVHVWSHVTGELLLSLPALHLQLVSSMYLCPEASILVTTSHQDSRFSAPL
jgi:hypothetical protein